MSETDEEMVERLERNWKHAELPHHYDIHTMIYLIRKLWKEKNDQRT